MRNVLEAIAKTVREVVGGVDSPFRAGAVVFCFQYPVGCQVPHLGVAVLHVLFHT